MCFDMVGCSRTDNNNTGRSGGAEPPRISGGGSVGAGSPSPPRQLLQDSVHQEPQQADVLVCVCNVFNWFLVCCLFVFGRFLVGPRG